MFACGAERFARLVSCLHRQQIGAMTLKIGQDLEPVHNIVYMNGSTAGKWALFPRFVTIHPEPWTEDDPEGLMQSNMMFPTLEAMCDALPELTERIHPKSGKHVLLGQQRTATQRFAGADELVSQTQVTLQARGNLTLVSQGKASALVLRRLQVGCSA